VDRQAFAGIFVEDRQHPQLAATLCPCFQEVIRPNLIRTAGTLERPSGVTKAPFPELAPGQLQPFLASDAVDPLTINPIAIVLEHGRDDPVAVHRLFVGIFPDK